MLADTIISTSPSSSLSEDDNTTSDKSSMLLLASDEACCVTGMLDAALTLLSFVCLVIKVTQSLSLMLRRYIDVRLCIRQPLINISYIPKYRPVVFLASHLTHVSNCHDYNFASFISKIKIS